MKRKIVASVIIPTYNRGQKIEKTIEAIERNEISERIKIIIVDDFSEKSQKKRIQRLNKKYKNLFYLRNKQNEGPSFSRNRGIENAEGEIIFFTDDDCIVPKNWLKTYIHFLKKNKKVAGVGGRAVPISNNFIAKLEELKCSFLKIKVNKIIIGKENLPTGFTGNMAYRKRILEEYNGFDEKLRRGEDMDLKRRISEKYLLAAHPLTVQHDHNFNLNYLLDRIIKEGLDIKPPKRIFIKILFIFFLSPYLIYNVIKKTIRYRKR